MRVLRVGVSVVVLACAAVRAGTAQRAEWDANRSMASRQALEELLAGYQQAAESPAYSAALRAEGRESAARIRLRLQEGDFLVGDRFLLTIEERTPPTSDTLTVSPQRTVVLAGIGEVSLVGVLRSELETFLVRRVREVERGAVLHVRTLVRLAILGEVGRPGFYAVPTDALFEETVMLAGGPSREGKLEAIRVERGNIRVWEGRALQEAMAAGQTVDGLGLRPGDQIVVPRRRTIDTYTLFRTLGLIVTLPAVLLGATRIF